TGSCLHTVLIARSSVTPCGPCSKSMMARSRLGTPHTISNASSASCTRWLTPPISDSASATNSSNPLSFVSRRITGAFMPEVSRTHGFALRDNCEFPRISWSCVEAHTESVILLVVLPRPRFAVFGLRGRRREGRVGRGFAYLGEKAPDVLAPAQLRSRRHDRGGAAGNSETHGVADGHVARQAKHHTSYHAVARSNFAFNRNSRRRNPFTSFRCCQKRSGCAHGHDHDLRLSALQNLNGRFFQFLFVD